MSFKINKNCYFTKLDDKAVVLNTSSGIYYELDQKACYIWKMLEENHQHEEIIDSYAENFNVSKKNSTEALKKFVEQARNEGFIE